MKVCSERFLLPFWHYMFDKALSWLSHTFSDWHWVWCCHDHLPWPLGALATDLICNVHTVGIYTSTTVSSNYSVEGRTCHHVVVCAVKSFYTYCFTSWMFSYGTYMSPDNEATCAEYWILNEIIHSMTNQLCVKKYRFPFKIWNTKY